MVVPQGSTGRRVGCRALMGLMEEPRYDPASYGESHAGVYDRIYAHVFQTDLACRHLVALAERTHAPILDLGIGTGRIALPLRKAGIDVHGIDASDAMINRLRAQPGGADVPVWRADMADFDLPDRYGVIVCAVSTLFMLPDRATQIGCLRSAARHLRPGGVLIVEAFVPDPVRYDHHGERVEVRHLDDDSLHLVLSQHRPRQQTVTVTHVLAGAGGVRSYPVVLSYAWPTELDLMAGLVGLELVERTGGWDDRPYDDTTTDHVSTYRHRTVLTSD